MRLKSDKAVQLPPVLLLVAVLVNSLFLYGCGPKLPPAPAVVTGKGETPFYIIGPGDNVNIFVWGNPEVSTSVVVRPDGRITVPLVEDLQASGKTPTELARAVEAEMSRYIRSPIVTIMMSGFVGRFKDQIRVVGEATEPQALPYKEKMTLLDLMIAVGGVTEFAAGNSAVLVRTVDDELKQYNLRIEDLIKDGDITANVEMLPGDILIIPEAWF